MSDINLHGGLVMVGVSDEQAALMKGRGAFVLNYCKTQNWNPDALEISQIMEIRKQDGWNTPAA